MSLIQGISFSYRELNQDSYCIVPINSGNQNLCAIADGIGSYYLSEEASAFVTIKVLKEIEQRIILSLIHISEPTRPY